LQRLVRVGKEQQHRNVVTARATVLEQARYSVYR
jgi:hypothetical protein